jgi:hypothetical protein
MATNTAPIKWAQRTDNLYLTIAVPDVKDETITLSDDKLVFKGKSGDKTYEVDIEFYKPCLGEESTYKVMPRSIQMLIVKKDSGEDEDFWPRLLKDKSKEKNQVNVDWDRYVDQDEEAEAGDFDASGLEGGNSMGGGQGGPPGMGGGMPGMGGPGGGAGGPGGMDMAEMMKMMQGMGGGEGGPGGAGGMDMQAMMAQMGMAGGGGNPAMAAAMGGGMGQMGADQMGDDDEGDSDDDNLPDLELDGEQ